MTFDLTPVDAPAAARASTEFDELIPQVQALQPKWASVPVKASEVDGFKRRFRDAANRAELSGKFAKDGEQTEDGNVLLTFTVQPRIVRKANGDGQAETPADTADRVLGEPAPEPVKGRKG